MGAALQFSRRIDYWAALFGLNTTKVFTQQSSFDQGSRRITNEMVLIAKWFGIILRLRHRPDSSCEASRNRC